MEKKLHWRFKFQSLFMWSAAKSIIIYYITARFVKFFPNSNLHQLEFASHQERYLIFFPSFIQMCYGWHFLWNEMIFHYESWVISSLCGMKWHHFFTSLEFHFMTSDEAVAESRVMKWNERRVKKWCHFIQHKEMK